MTEITENLSETNNVILGLNEADTTRKDLFLLEYAPQNHIATPSFLSTIAVNAPTQHLPDASKLQMDFLDSSFFRMNISSRGLPTPTEVRALARSEDRATPEPPPIKYENLNLIVKYGPHVSIAEAQCLWFIQRVFQNAIPIPEVYGWRVEGHDVFIYMQLISGRVLKDCWDSFNDTEKTSVCDQLRQILGTLRGYRQSDSDPFIGSINRQSLLDYVFESKPPGGPFPSIKAFNDWFSWLPQSCLPDSQKYQDPYRHLLPDNGVITLTHADLHRGNIIVSSTAPPRIVAIIDWGQAGWYPDYWEYCKASYTSIHHGRWRNEWIPRFLFPRTQEHEVFGEYVMAMGAV